MSKLLFCSLSALMSPSLFLGEMYCLNYGCYMRFGTSSMTSSGVLKCLHGGMSVHLGHRLFTTRSLCSCTAAILSWLNRFCSSFSQISSFERLFARLIRSRSSRSSTVFLYGDECMAFFTVRGDCYCVCGSF